MSEDMRNALNAFLYRTGEPSGKFMVVFASNQPNQFDYAINDRIDEFIEFNLPGEAERRKILAQYLEKYILNPPKGARPITVDAEIGEDFINDVARRIDGFSGREISKLAIAWQATAYGTEHAVLTKELMEGVLNDHISQKKRKTSWNDQLTWHLDPEQLAKDS
jgi:ATPase family AAA domain-containing protein 3A/B